MANQGEKETIISVKARDVRKQSKRGSQWRILDVDVGLKSGN